MYRTVNDIYGEMYFLSQFFPQLCARIQLPEPSVEGQPVYALRLRAGSGTARRGVLVVGGTHARELMNPDAMHELSINLLVSYQSHTDLSYGGRTWSADDIQLILDALDLWFVPCSNPDGRRYVMTVDDMWRKNRRDHPGTTCEGVDLNRNLDVLWGIAQGQTSCSPCSDVYCGPSAFSEPETRNIKFLLDTERIVTFVDVHSFSQLVLYPWSHAATQSSDPSQQFTSLPTGTCTASIPSTYQEYMPPLDVQRFTTVAGQIVTDIAAVRGSHYTPQTGFGLYATTGSHEDYAYARHIADPSLPKTYGFTFETGPNLGTGRERESFHPADPEPIKLDAKAAILSLLQQSVCAIELIGVDLFGEKKEMAALRAVRDQLLATTAAGRAWIELFERVQFRLLSALLRKPKLLAEAIRLLKTAAQLITEEQSVFTPADATAAQQFVQKLQSSTKDRTVQTDLAAVSLQLAQMGGRTSRKVIESLLRQKPKLSTAPLETQKASDKTAAGKPKGRQKRKQS